MRTSYSRGKHWARHYHGRRTIGGCLVHAGNDLLDKHLPVHPVSPGGFDKATKHRFSCFTSPNQLSQRSAIPAKTPYSSRSRLFLPLDWTFDDWVLAEVEAAEIHLYVPFACVASSVT